MANISNSTYIYFWWAFGTRPSLSGLQFVVIFTFSRLEAPIFCIVLPRRCKVKFLVINHIFRHRKDIKESVRNYQASSKVVHVCVPIS